MHTPEKAIEAKAIIPVHLMPILLDNADVKEHAKRYPREFKASKKPSWASLKLKSV